MSWLFFYAERLRASRFSSLQAQRYESVGEFSRTWNDFVFYESARAAEQIGYGKHPLAFFNDVLYSGA